MKIVSLKAEKRTEFGTKAAKAIRKSGKVPCVLYGADVLEHFQIAPLDLRPLIYSPEFKLAEIDLDGKIVKCILKDYDFHPITDEIIHVDFLALTAGVIVKADIPVSFRGVSKGEKLGGKRIQLLRKVTVKTLPDNLVSELFVDMVDVSLGDSVRVRDIEKPDNMEIMQEGNIPIATVEVPRALKSLEAEEAEARAQEADKEAAVTTEDSE